MKWPHLSQVLDRLGVDTSVIRPRNEHQVSIPCPLAPWTHRSKTDANPSCSLYFDDPKSPTLFKCFSCLESGKLWWLVHQFAEYANREDLAALSNQLLDEDKPDLGTMLAAATEDIDSWVLRADASAPRVLNPSVLDSYVPAWHHKRSQSYLKYRKVNEFCAELFDLRFDARNDRIVFPVYDRENRLLGAVGRLLGDGARKYYNYFGFNSGKTLGGMNHLHSDRTHVMIVEGFFDVLNAYPTCRDLNADVLCSWHAELTPKQAELVLMLDRSVSVWYDPDQAGDSGWTKAKDLLDCAAYSVRRVRPPEGSDVGELSHAQFVSLHARK